MTDTTEPTTYDYVIVGGGTAGCVLAGRLSEDPTVTVLLLEAGREDRNLLIHVPAGFAKLTSGAWEWGLTTLPQRHAKDRTIPYAQGKVIGGGGSINAQVFTRGTAADYDGWAANGADGWSAADVQPYFLRSERNARLSAPFHGTEGQLSVSDQINPHPLSLAFVQAGQEAGLPYNSDFNGASQIGVGLYQSTTGHGRRCSAAVAYLRPARRRKNLTVAAVTTVDRIVVRDGRAEGVTARGARGTAEYRARREVLVCAGAIGSPKLLELSGIGDPAHLKAAGVDVVHALPGVGENLQDHCDLDVIYELKDKQGLDRLERVGPASAAAAAQYAATRTGPLASTVVEAGAFTRGGGEEDRADLQFHFLPAAGVEAGVAGLRRGYGMTINSYFLRPVSRGSVHIRSSDPTAQTGIDPNYFADDHDLEMAIEGVKQTREIAAQPSLAKHIKAERIAGDAPLTTRDDYIDFVRTYGRTSYHPVGTCRMGTGDDAVVDLELRVRGIRGLRVVDASVMPALISSNTQAPTVMIAEKAVDLIRAAAR